LLGESVMLYKTLRTKPVDAVFAGVVRLAQSYGMEVARPSPSLSSPHVVDLAGCIHVA